MKPPRQQDGEITLEYIWPWGHSRRKAEELKDCSSSQPPGTSVLCRYPCWSKLQSSETKEKKCSGYETTELLKIKQPALSLPRGQTKLLHSAESSGHFSPRRMCLLCFPELPQHKKPPPWTSRAKKRRGGPKPAKVSPCCTLLHPSPLALFCLWRGLAAQKVILVPWQKMLFINFYICAPIISSYLFLGHFWFSYRAGRLLLSPYVIAANAHSSIRCWTEVSWWSPVLDGTWDSERLWDKPN